MNLLLDTHVLLWAAGEPDKLSDATRALLLDEANRLFFSVASIWEVVIKRGLGREDFRVDPARLRRLLVLNGYGEVALTSRWSACQRSTGTPSTASWSRRPAWKGCASSPPTVR